MAQTKEEGTDMNQALISEPTERQLSFLTRLLGEARHLLAERERITGCEWPEAFAQVARMSDTDGRTRKEVSVMIDTAMDNNEQLRTELEGLGWEPAAPRAQAGPPKTFVETGMYRVGERIFKVLPSRESNRHYAKELTGFHWEDKIPVADSDDNFAFVYAKGAMAIIEEQHRLSDEAARAFGSLTGHCVVCGRLLTDPKSIEAGIGPVCSGKR